VVEYDNRAQEDGYEYDGRHFLIEDWISEEDIKKVFPEHVSLVEVDRNDSFAEDKDVLNAIIQGDETATDEVEFDDLDGLIHYIDEIEAELKLEWEDDVVEDAFDEWDDLIREYLWDENSSNPEEDKLRNTPDDAAFVETEVEIESDLGMGDDDDLNEAIALVMETFGVLPEYRSVIKMMLLQSSYGGMIRIYFSADFYKMITTYEKENAIIFKDRIILACVTSYHGAGDHCEVEINKTLTYDRKSAFLCKSIKYSYTYEVCGMNRNWADYTNWHLDKANLDETPETEAGRQKAREEHYDLVFSQGSCSHGDMKITRHRNVTYINDYPCGNKCLDCLTFWID
jgi:hypothetical protein